MQVHQASGYIEGKNENKYLLFYDYVNQNKEVLKTYTDAWNGIKSEIKEINGGKKMITEKIRLKWNLILTMTFH